MLRALLPLLAVVAIFIAVAGAGAVSAGTPARPVGAPAKPPLSSGAVVILCVLSGASLVAGVYLKDEHGDAWWLVPVVAWWVGYRAVRGWSNQQAERQLEAERARERERLEKFGRDGVKSLRAADAAVKRILSTEAARTGWLGPPDELDFGAELAVIAENLRKASAIRKVMAESAAIPDPTTGDVQLHKDAKRMLKQLEGAAAEQVKILAKCAGEVEQVDRMLDDDREQSRIALERDDVRARLNALLYGAQLASSGQPADSVEAVLARVEAFRELRALVTQPAAVDTADDEPREASSNVLQRVVGGVWRRIGW